jgi:flagellar L-ring protein precursor FlgH
MAAIFALTAAGAALGQLPGLPPAPDAGVPVAPAAADAVGAAAPVATSVVPATPAAPATPGAGVAGTGSAAVGGGTAGGGASGAASPLAGPAATAQTIRPSEKPERAPVVSPTGALRGSLFEQAAAAPVPLGANGEPAGGAPVSFTALAPPKPKKYQKNDIVTVIVSLNSSSASTSQLNSQKQQTFDAALQQFVQLATSASGVPSVGVVGQPSKLPEVKFQYNNNRQNQADEQRSDTLTDRFAAVVVDVKPNGTLVLEAIQQVAMDKEVLHYKMSGICRTADITPDDTILSTQLANLNLSKQTSGEVRNGVQSGWLNSLIDKFGPF